MATTLNGKEILSELYIDKMIAEPNKSEPVTCWYAQCIDVHGTWRTHPGLMNEDGRILFYCDTSAEWFVRYNRT